MKRITSIESNVKQAGRIDFATPCVFLAGPHEAGKSAFIDSLWFAYTMTHPSIGSAPADLLTLAPNHSAPMYVNVSYDDGNQLRTEIADGDTSSAKKPKQRTPFDVRGSLIHTDILNLLAESAPEMRRQIMRRFGGDEVALLSNPPVGLADSDLQIWNYCYALTNGPPEERAAGLIKEVRKLKLSRSVESASGKAWQGVLSGPVPSIPLTDEEVQRLRVASNELHEVVAAWEVQPRKHQLAVQIAELSSHHDCRPDLDAAQKQLEKATADYAQMQTLSALAEVAGTVCPLCQTEGKGVDALRFLSGAREALPRYFKALEDAKAAYAVAQAAVTTWMAERTWIHAYEQQCAAFPVEPSISVDNAKATLAEIDRRLSQSENARKLKQSRDQATTELEKLRVEFEACQRVEKLVSQVLTTAVTTTAGRLSAELNKYLPDGMQAGVQLYDNEREVCRIGLTDGKTVIPAKGCLSGKQIGNLIVAFAAVIGRGMEHSVLILDDDILGHFREPKAMWDLYTKCAKLVQDGMVSNVIACGTWEAVPFSRSIATGNISAMPDGWSIIDVTKVKRC